MIPGCVEAGRINGPLNFGAQGARGDEALPPIVAFVHIQKTAGTSMKFILKNSFGSGHCDVNAVDSTAGAPFGQEDLKFVRRICPWLRSVSGHEIIEPTRHLGERVMPYTMLRDPVARMISHFQDKKVRGHKPIELDDFLRDTDNHNFQVRKIAGEPDLQKACDLLAQRYFFVGLTERFDLSMKVFQSLFPYPVNRRYRVQHIAKDNRIRQGIESNPESIERMVEANQLDAGLYSFVDKQLFPALIEKAGLSDMDVLPTVAEIRSPAVKYIASRVFHKLVYRTLLKRERRKSLRLENDSKLSGPGPK